tara:strand:- start:511 stop:732 length:222 start_codon:yes stop_codon:yes gene_type:complete
MPTDDQKKQWKKESDQLKKDLDSKSKVVKKRKVDIKFGGVKKGTDVPSQKQASSSGSKPNSGQDDFLRNRLGL